MVGNDGGRLDRRTTDAAADAGGEETAMESSSTTMWTWTSTSSFETDGTGDDILAICGWKNDDDDDDDDDGTLSPATFTEDDGHSFRYIVLVLLCCDRQRTDEIMCRERENLLHQEL